MRIGIVYTHIPVNQPIRMSFLANDKIQKSDGFSEKIEFKKAKEREDDSPFRIIRCNDEGSLSEKENMNSLRKLLRNLEILFGESWNTKKFLETLSIKKDGNTMLFESSALLRMDEFAVRANAGVSETQWIGKRNYEKYYIYLYKQDK